MDEYMVRIGELVERFAKVDTKWKNVIYTDKEKTEEYAELKTELEMCYFEAVQFIIKNSLDMDEFKKRVSKLLGNRAFVSLCAKMNAVIKIFENSNLINGITDKAGFINECFDKAIVRRESDFIDEWEKFGFSTSEEMLRAISALSKIATGHVKMSFAKRTANSEFKRITDLDDELCSIYAEKYENSYEKLQMKMILRAYAEFNERFNDFIDAITDEEE